MCALLRGEHQRLLCTLRHLAKEATGAEKEGITGAETGASFADDATEGLAVAVVLEEGLC